MITEVPAVGHGVINPKTPAQATGPPHLVIEWTADLLQPATSPPLRH